MFYLIRDMNNLSKLLTTSMLLLVMISGSSNAQPYLSLFGLTTWGIPGGGDSGIPDESYFLLNANLPLSIGKNLPDGLALDDFDRHQAGNLQETYLIVDLSRRATCYRSFGSEGYPGRRSERWRWSAVPTWRSE